MARPKDPYARLPVLPESEPVPMPDLPPRKSLTTVAQFRALSHPRRARILGIIQNQPATAKQIAGRLGSTPGAIGHHLHRLEQAGLARVVARRSVRGVVAKYYTRTARIFDYDRMPKALTGKTSVPLDILRQAWGELAESPGKDEAGETQVVGFPHVRLSPRRARHYHHRLKRLLDDVIHEPAPAAEGEVYSLCVALFVAPAYLQTARPQTADR